jgi:hypothetical protein
VVQRRITIPHQGAYRFSHRYCRGIQAGGAWSVLGVTTTTMMWIAGISPPRVVEAIVASAVELFIFGIPAAIQQHKHSPILRGIHIYTHVDWMRLGIVGLILVLAIGTNVTVNLKFAEQADNFPFIGMAVWVAILLSIPMRRPDWKVPPMICSFGPAFSFHPAPENAAQPPSHIAVHRLKDVRHLEAPPFFSYLWCYVLR